MASVTIGSRVQIQVDHNIDEHPIKQRVRTIVQGTIQSIVDTEYKGGQVVTVITFEGGQILDYDTSDKPPVITVL